jgi:hypothetical protein
MVMFMLMVTSLVGAEVILVNAVRTVAVVLAE